VRPTKSDASRHLICPTRETRTKLNTLGDGRRKCTVCGKKFRINKVTEETKLQQCAEILLGFCLDFSAQRAAQITHHRYRLVAVYYDHFRRLLTEKNLPKEKIGLLSEHSGHIHILQDKSRCRWCKTKLRPGSEKGKPPVFGVQFKDTGEVYIDPLKDDEAVFHFHTSGSQKEVPGRREGYAGFICCGKFHRFTKEEKAADGAEQLWTWIRQRIRSHHGIWKRNTGYYLKELEWKYNHRSLQPDVQAQKIIELMPADFLTSWSLKPEPHSAAIPPKASRTKKVQRGT
jgi:transposase